MNTLEITTNLEDVLEGQYTDTRKIGDFFAEHVEAIKDKVGKLMEGIRVRMVEDMDYMEEGLAKIFTIKQEMENAIKNEEMKIFKIIDKANNQNELDLLMQKLYI